MVLLALILPCFLDGAQPGAAAAAAPDFSGTWNGSIEIPGTPLAIAVHLEVSGGSWSGTIDIPAQNAKGLALSAVRVAGDSLSFEIAGVPGEPTFHGVWSGGQVKGAFSQGGQQFNFSLSREASAGPEHPDEPKPPYPYKTEEVKVTSGGVTLAGTLTEPEKGGPFPAAILITGSGPQNRDEEVFGHKPFLVLADCLTRAGIAVLRTDDRGVGGSGGSLSECNSETLAQDALAEVAFLRARSEIAASKVGLIGHSEGGLIAPIAASESKDVAYIVMLAGPGVPGDEILHQQAAKIYGMKGAPPDSVAAVLDQHRKVLSLVKAGADSVALLPEVKRLVRLQVGLQGGSLSGDKLDRQARASTRQMLGPWFKFFVSFDPRTALAKVQVPVLALNGALDVQVDPDQNLPAIEAALKAAGNSRVTVRRLPGLNHLFQKAKTGGIEEYATIPETMSPEALHVIRDWVLSHTEEP